MRKHLFVTLLLTCGLPFSGQMFALANPEPQQMGQAAESIKGTVLDENNEPVIGASVTLKGQSQGVSTDAFGNFTISAVPGAQITVSYVGYKSETVRAAQGMSVYLQPTTEMLDQLVVVGYGTQKKADLTGAVSTVDVARVMDSRPIQDVTKALQGAVPGLTITTLDGGISSDATIKIRGVGTLSNGQESSPLIVVDGVPVDNLNFLNAEDIADISVLKDAASSSIYGARAAFGVILITTKNADSKDRVSLKYTNNFAWSGATILPRFANNVDEITGALQARFRGSGSWNTEVGGMNYLELLPYAQAWYDQHNGKAYTDYRQLMPFQSMDNVGDYIVRPDGTWLRYAQWDVAKTLLSDAAPSQKHNVSLEGSKGKTNYRMSFGYDSKQGLNHFNPEKMQRYMANVNVSTEIFSFLKAGAIINFSQRNYQDPNLVRNSYQYLWRWPSYMETYGWTYDENGNKMGFRNDIENRLQGHIDHQYDTQTRMQAWMEATIIDGLKLRGEFNYDIRNHKENDAYTPQIAWNTWSANAFEIFQTPEQPGTFARKTTWDSSRWTMNVYATYDKTFNKAHNLKVMLGANAEEYKYDYSQFRIRGLIDYDLPTLNLADGGTDKAPVLTGFSLTHSATAGFFGRINYDYKGRYLVEVNGRYDGSSKFPANDQWAFFPSVSAGWRFSEEPFFKTLKETWWNNGKIRASYGSIGNENIGNNMFISTIAKLAATTPTWLDPAGQRISEWGLPSLVSNSLTWERIYTTDFGIDLGFLNNSLNFSFDWYSRETKDMLAQGETLPSVLGTSNALTNAGSLRTNGWELSANWNHSFGDADIYATFTLADAKTKVTRINNPTGIIYQSIPYTTDRSRFYEGQYVGEIWGFEFDRFFTTDDFTWDTPDGKYAPGASQTGYAPGIPDQSPLEKGVFKYGPGDVKFKDLDGDGVISPGEQTIFNHGDAKIIGNQMPRFEYSFRIGGAWKGFDIDMFFQGVGKRNVWSSSSNVVPFAQTTGGLFDHQLDYNRVIVDEMSTNYTIIGYDIDQNNLYPTPYAGSFGFSNFSTMFGQGQFNFYPQDRYLTNMAYLRFKNLTFGYTLPTQITQKALIQKARIYFSADNLCLLYNGARKFKIDPEIFGGDYGASSMGVAAFGRTMPMMRTFSFGIQVTF